MSEDIALFRQELPRWKERSAQALATNVSAREAKEFRKLSISLNTDFATMHDPMLDVIEEHRAFLKALRNSILRDPPAYGPEAAAAEARQVQEHRGQKARSRVSLGDGERTLATNSAADAIELDKVTIGQLFSAMGRLTFGSWVVIISGLLAILGAAYGLGLAQSMKQPRPGVAPAQGDSGVHRSIMDSANRKAGGRDSIRMPAARSAP